MKTFSDCVTYLAAIPRRWIGKRQPSQGRGRRANGHSFRPTVEQFEDRLMPSSIPPAPTFTAAAVSDTQANLAWTPVSGATGYQVEEYLASNKSWENMATLGSTATSYSVTGLNSGTLYYFTVVDTCAGGGLSGGNVESVTTLGGSAAPPTFTITAPASGTQANLAWQPVTGAAGYVIAEGTGGSSSTVIATLGSTVTSYSVTGLTPGSTSWFGVAEIMPSGNFPPERASRSPAWR